MSKAASKDDEKKDVESQEPGAFLKNDAGFIIGIFPPRQPLKLLREFFHDKSKGYVNEQGYQLEGHQCVSELDKRLEKEQGGSLLYGEVLPEGVCRLLDDSHLNVNGAKVVYDFGMGTGKLCFQVFLQYPHVQTVVGIEISPSRYMIGCAAMRKLAQRRNYALVTDNEFTCTVIHTSALGRRTLELRCGDAFESMNPRSYLSGMQKGFVQAADIIFMNTDFPPSCSPRLCLLLTRLARGTRIATFGDMKKTFQTFAAAAGIPASTTFPLTQYPCNEIVTEDRFRTTWAPKNGHHFYLWKSGKFAPNK